MKKLFACFVLIITSYLYATTYYASRYIYLEDVFFVCMENTIPGRQQEDNNNWQPGDTHNKLQSVTYNPISRQYIVKTIAENLEWEDCLAVEKYVLAAKNNYEIVIAPWDFLAQLY